MLTNSHQDESLPRPMSTRAFKRPRVASRSQHPLAAVQQVYVSGPWAIVQVDSISSETRQAIVRDLTLEPCVFAAGGRKQGEPIPAYMYIDEGKSLCVPRAYYHKFKRPIDEHESYRVALGNGDPVSEKVRFTGMLRNEDQHRFVRDLSDFLSRHARSGGAIALGSGEPGCGKTACFLHIWSTTLKRKALIIVRGLPIVHQWVYAVRKFVPEARVGIIHQNTWEIAERDIVIASADTLSSRACQVKSSLWKLFGVVCFDEAHHLVASTLVRVYTSCMRARYCISLTGTPDRKDGLTKELEYFTGPNVAFMKNKEVIHVHRLVFSGGQERISEYHYGPAKGKYNDQRMLNYLVEDTARLTFLTDLLVECIFAGRKVLVLSSRCSLREALEVSVEQAIQSWLDQGRHLPEKATQKRHPLRVSSPKLSASDRRIFKYQKALDALFLEQFRKTDLSDAETSSIASRHEELLQTLGSRMRPDEIECARRRQSRGKVGVPDVEDATDLEPIQVPCIASLRATDKAVDRQWKFHARIIIATYEMAREALDVSGLDTLMFATPVVDVRQAVGRIRRGTAQKLDTHDPSPYIRAYLQKPCGIVLDVIDPFGPFEKWAEKRALFYRSQRKFIEMYES